MCETYVDNAEYREQHRTSTLTAFLKMACKNVSKNTRRDYKIVKIL
jgi:hypothetical protein